ncbi:MAG: energy transducer TonB [Bacteroidota bacterium]|nr:energy transducer TonB [Bacteroidota bacterium]
MGNTIFTKVEKEAYFPGGLQSWNKFLEKNLNAGVPVENGAPIGKYTVTIQFIVDIDGKLSGFKALSGQGYGMENEVIRVLQKSPRWIPAVQDGHPVKAYRKQSFTFYVTKE